MHVNQETLEKARVLIVGDIMLDRYWLGDVNRISPEAPVPVVLVDRTDDRLGGAGNVAVNVSALGGKTSLLGVVGSDEAGTIVDELLRHHGIRSYIQVDDSISTTVKLRILARQQHLLRCDFEDVPNREILANSLTLFESILNQNDILVLSDYGKGGLSHIEQMIEIAKLVGKPVLVDPKGSDYMRYRGTTILTPNRAELKQVVGNWKTEEELTSKAQNLREKLSIKYLLLTRSEEGMTLYYNGGQFTIPAQAREVYDVSGAGDTVIAVCAAMYAIGMPIEDIVRTANRAGGIVVGKLGTASITCEELFENADL